MLTIRHITSDGVRHIGGDEIEAAVAGDGFVWVDLSAATPDEEGIVDHPALRVDAMAREDMIEDVHLPKLDLYADHLLLTVHAIEVESSAYELTTNELDIVMGPRHLVTFHRRPVHAIESVGALTERPDSTLHRPVEVMHAILETLDDVFVPFLDMMGRRLDVVEADVLAGPDHATRSEIFALRRDLITLRRISVPQAEVIRRLGREHIALIDPADRAYFRDVHDHLYRMAEVAEAYRQLLESAYEMYRSVREDDLNRRLTVLTMISALLLPITTIAGIYGMNFDHMPELRQAWAYPLVLGSFVLIIVVGLWRFRSWGWIGGPTAAEAEERRRRRAGLDILELPLIGQVLRVPAYGARFAIAGSKRALGIGRLLLRGRPTPDDEDEALYVDA